VLGKNKSEKKDALSKVRRHVVNRINKTLPLSPDALNIRRTSKLSLRSDLQCDPSDLSSETTELSDPAHPEQKVQLSAAEERREGIEGDVHRIDRHLQLPDLARSTDIDRLTQVAVCDRLGNARDFTHLESEVLSHLVDGFGLRGGKEEI
jgi:hypothetical protein